MEKGKKFKDFNKSKSIVGPVVLLKRLSSAKTEEAQQKVEVLYTVTVTILLNFIH